MSGQRTIRMIPDAAQPRARKVAGEPLADESQDSASSAAGDRVARPESAPGCRRCEQAQGTGGLHRLGFGPVEGAPGGGLVAERVPGDRLQQERVNQPERPVSSDVSTQVMVSPVPAWRTMRAPSVA